MSEKVNKILYLALSLLLAIIFWLYVDNVKGNTIPKEFNAVPVEFIGAEDATIDLTVTGPRAIVSSMRRGDVRVQVNLTSVTTVGTHPMTYTYATSDNININDISIQGSRSTITVQVAPLYSKRAWRGTWRRAISTCPSSWPWSPPLSPSAARRRTWTRWRASASRWI